jgi:hypothetical protein
MGTIGLIGGIMAAIGVFLPWATLGEWSGSGWGATEVFTSPYVVLIGGIIALVGGIALVVMNKPPLALLGASLLICGGIIAIFGGIWGISNVGGIGANISFGLLLCVIGSILALVAGFTGLVTGVSRRSA